MADSSSYPVVLYPPALAEALKIMPVRERYEGKPPEKRAFAPALSFEQKLRYFFLRLFGRSTEVARLTLAHHEPTRLAYETAMADHMASWQNFERVQDERFTEKALHAYRSPSITRTLDLSIPETGRTSRVTAGATEYGFYRFLKRHFGDRIYRRWVVQLDGTDYHPDFVFFDPPTRLRIDIELDEPYGLRDRLPIHVVEATEKGEVRVDERRDTAFITGKWVVVRFAESQVVLDPEGCCRVLADIIMRVTGETFSDLTDAEPVTPTPRWTRAQANTWAEENYRYAFIERAEREADQPLPVAARPFVPSPHQQTIFDFLANGQGHGLVTAVAGSGKSTTLLEATRLVREQNSHARILLLAFNRSIRDELEARISAAGISDVHVVTLNSYGLAVLTRTLGATTLNGSKYANLVSRAARDLGVILKGAQKKGEGDKDYAKRLIDLCRAYITVDPNDLGQLCALGVTYSIPQKRTERLQAVVVRALELGEALAIEEEIIDFDDQCYLPVRLHMPQESYDYVLVDECQDLTQTQLELVRRAAGDRGRLLFVGDPRQAIMGFRGADNGSIENIKHLPGGVTELDLTVCYRCPTSHIELAQPLMPSIIAAEGATAGTVQSLSWADFPSYVREGDLLFARTKITIRKAVVELIAGGHTLDYRAHGTGDESSGSTNVIEDTVKLLCRAAQVYPEPLPMPKLQPGQKEDPVLKMLPRALEALKHDALSWGEDFEAYVTHRTRPDPRFGVTICTAHQAKGLEADHVFILGESQFGCSKPEQPTWEREQELNLKYVAYTRAKNALYRVMHIPV